MLVDEYTGKKRFDAIDMIVGGKAKFGNHFLSKYCYSVLDAGYKAFGFDGKILTEAVMEAFGYVQPQF